MRENSKRHSREETRSEQEYLAAFQRGEEQGFTHYFNELYAALLFYAFRKLNDKPKAEDIVEGAFIKIWENRGTFTKSKVIKAWLYTRVRIDCEGWLMQQIGHKQNKGKQKKRSKQGTPEMSKDELREIVRAETTRNLHAFIESLPTACGQILKMLRINGKSIKEISRELHLTPQTIRNQVRRANAILQEKFPGKNFGDI